MQPLRALLFDLGNTLIYQRESWKPFMRRGCYALAQALKASGLPVDVPRFAGAFYQRLRVYYAERDQTLLERSTIQLLAETIQDHHWEASPETQRSALNALYAITQQNWQVEEDAVSTLKTLQQTGFRMGLVSNASDDEDVRALVEQAQLGPFLEFVLTSASCGFRKPRAEIFERALAHWNFSPEQVGMVGDTLSADILGANRMGIYSIWITRRVEHRPVGTHTLPALSISTLGQLPRHLQYTQ